MSISQIEENEIPEGFGRFSITHVRGVGGEEGQQIVAEAGQHPKCRLLKAWQVPLIWDTAGDTSVIEHEDGGDIGTVQGAADLAPVEITIAPAAGYTSVFEKNEPIIVNMTEGNAANSTLVVMDFLAVH